MHSRNPKSVLKSLLKSGNPPTQRQLLQVGRAAQRTGSTFRKIQNPKLV
ncbi:hypothetical protein LC593_04620 [Nostoc sp. CHAB 5844]|nr:hypothetical protein [Nostoc sp. CHAB 5844]